MISKITGLILRGMNKTSKTIEHPFPYCQKQKYSKALKKFHMFVSAYTVKEITLFLNTAHSLNSYFYSEAKCKKLQRNKGQHS